MKAKTKYLKATKVARIENLIFSGFDLSTDFFTLTYSQLSTLKDCMDTDNWYSLQRVYNKMTKQ